MAVPVAAILLYGLWIWGYFSWHWEDSATRKAIYAEAQVLMHMPPGKDLVLIPAPPGEGPSDIYQPRRVPKAIESLKPFSVDIEKDGVWIPTRHYFDDESGYFVPRDKAFDPRRKGIGSWEPIGDGVWWYHLS